MFHLSELREYQLNEYFIRNKKKCDTECPYITKYAYKIRTFEQLHTYTFKQMLQNDI